MSLNPINNPLAISIFVDVIVTLIVDSKRGLLDFSIGSNLWVHLLNFPIWIVCVVFAVCAFLKRLYQSWCVQLAMTYLFQKRQKKKRVNSLEELDQFKPRRPKTSRIVTDHSILHDEFSSSAVELRNTPMTARTRQARFA